MYEMVDCPRCYGTGQVPQANPECWECDGTGEVTQFDAVKIQDELKKEPGYKPLDYSE